MDTNANYLNYKTFGPQYLKALNVQNALGYKANWKVYEAAIGRDMRGLLNETDPIAHAGKLGSDYIIGWIGQCVRE